MITKREQERLAASRTDGDYKSNMFNHNRGNVVMIDGVAVPQTMGSSMGTALDTIFTWEQIFNAVMKYYKQQNE